MPKNKVKIVKVATILLAISFFAKEGSKKDEKILSIDH